MDLRFRKFRSPDLARLQDIRARAFAPVWTSWRTIVGDGMAEPLFGDADVKQGRHLVEITGSDGDDSIFVVEAESEIVGFIHLRVDCDRGVGEIGLNAVDPGFANRGVGTAIYRFAIDHFRARGLKVAEVSTGGDPSHEPARRAYAKAGFGFGIPGVSLYLQL